jgi:PAS domain-containing protein
VNDEAFAIGDVAAMVGVSAHTIRAWERRHGAVRPGRTASNRRLYSMDDVDFLIRVKRLSRARGLSLRLAVHEARGLGPAAEADVSPGIPDISAEGGLWRQLADSLPVVMLLVDGRGGIVDCNVAFARLVGRGRQEILGARFADAVDSYDRAKAVRMYRGPMQHRSEWEVNMRTTAGVSLYSFDCRPVQEGGTRLVGMVGRSLDRPEVV